VVSLKPILPSLAILAASACGQSLPDERALATRIEHAVRAAHPRLNLDGYARFYAHAPDATVRAIYVDARIWGQRGATVWTTPDALPEINDAGCGLLSIDYDAATDTLRSARCG
jgi:hypothetical protein